ncbi:hypothetical protein [Streptomyces sp. Ac-502]|uniref:hypothetical protein n=1 Tax=Streptomyces sp. Ac-502 TaxID=3342801 RepID=UPI003862C687
MSNVPSMTYTRIGAILYEIGMVSEAQMHSTLAEAANCADEPLEEHDEAACALEEFGVAVPVHADDIDSIYDDYATLLEDAVAVAGGKVAITDVRVVEGEGDLENGRLDRLEFERNGKPISILADHLAEDYYDQAAACEAIAETAHDDDPRTWRHLDFERRPHHGYDSIMVLATPEQAEALHTHLGFTFPN